VPSRLYLAELLAKPGQTVPEIRLMFEIAWITSFRTRNGVDNRGELGNLSTVASLAYSRHIYKAIYEMLRASRGMKVDQA
jgi:hypothetical protein